MNDSLWGYREIAEYTRLSLSRVRQIAADPTFPTPIRLFERSHPRRPAEEVREWVEARRG